MYQQIILVLKSLQLVFRSPAYIILSVIIALMFLSTSVFISQFGLIIFVWTSDIFSWLEKIKIFWSLSISLKTIFPLDKLILTIVLSLLIGINVATLIFYLKKRIIAYNAAGTSLLGTITGILGIGCFTCGSVILTSILGYSTAVAFISLLPFKGLEIGITGGLVLLFSIYLLTRRIQQSNLCL